MGWISCSSTGKHSAPEEAPTNTLSNIQMEIKIASGKKKLGFIHMEEGGLKAQQHQYLHFAKIKRSSRENFPFTPATAECLPGVQIFSN